MTPFERRAVQDYDAMIELIRARLDQLQIAHKTVDHLVGWSDGYLGKVVGDARIKKLGFDGGFMLLQALALKIEIVEDPEMLAKMEHRYEQAIVNKRVLNRHAPLGEDTINRAIKAGAREMGRRGGLKKKRYASIVTRPGGYARASVLSPKRRAEIAVNAARARWDKIRKAQRTAQQSQQPGAAT